MKFEVLKAGRVIATHELGEGTHRIGRTDDCAVKLEGSRVSKQHAMLVIRRNKAAIVDTGSSNGTFINGVLVQKQRVYVGDEIIVAEYKLRIAAEIPAPPARAGRGAGVALAVEAPPGTLAERFAQLVDQRVLKPYYGTLRTFDWRMILATILMGSLILSVLLGVVPVIRWANRSVERLSLDRAHTVLTQLVRDNYVIMNKTQDNTRLTVDAADGEIGFLSIYVLDPKTNTVLAPTKYFNKTINDIGSLRALERIAASDPTKPDTEKVSIPQGDDTYIVAQPIRLPSTDDMRPDEDPIDKKPQDVRHAGPPLNAVVIGSFRIRAGASATYEPLAEAGLFAFFVSLVAFFLITKMITYPIVTLQEQLDIALKGEEVELTSAVKMPELEALATTINFSVSKMRTGVSPPTAGDGAAAADDPIVATLQELDSGTSDGVLLLDRDKKVCFVGKILEDLIGLRMEYARGQNIGDACRDQAFAGTAIDLADRVLSSLGQVQNATLEINGVSRELIAVGHRSGTDIAFVILFVKLGGAA